MNPFLIIWLGFVHWVADFHLQTDEMAKGKSSSDYWLTKHVAVYTVALAFGTLLFGCAAPLFGGSRFGLGNLSWFIAINAFLHWWTDYVTSRQTTRLYLAERRHDFFVMIGLDQWVHQVTLVLTAYLLL